MDTFAVPAELVREMIEHAQAEYPKECCGLLIGPPGKPVALRRLRNIDPDPVMRYNADPKDLLRVNDEMYERDWEICSVYHSHTHTPPYPSKTDVARAFEPNAVYALVGLADRGNPEVRAFTISGEAVTELTIEQIASVEGS